MFRHRKVILIEDSPWVRDGLRVFFQHRDCALRVFRSPREAEEALSNERADLIICDYWLPEMDGLSVLSRMKTLQPDAFTILTASYLLPGTRAEAEGLGIHDLILKPITIPKLNRVLESLYHGDGNPIA